MSFLRWVIGDTKPDIVLDLEQDGEPLDLTDATVVFRLQKPSGAVVERTLTVTSAAAGRCEGSFGIGDLDETGRMEAEVVITYSGGDVQHTEDAIPVYVRDEYQEVFD